MKIILKFPLGVVVGLSLISLGCAPASASKTSQEAPSEIQESPGLRPAKICYSVSSNQTNCYDTIERAKLPNQTELYKYMDPYTAPSFPANFNKSHYVAPDRLIDLRNIPANQLVSPHFVRNELMPESSTRGFYGLFSTAALSKLEQLRVAINRPLRITSGYRSPGHNAKLDGGANWSRHTYGDGLDFKVSGMTYKALAQQCVKYGAGFYQVYTDHIHCDWRGLESDPAFYPDHTDSRISTLAKTIETIQAESKILVRAQISQAGAQNSVLEALVPKEDDGELIYEWQVSDETGAVWNSNERLFKVPYENHTYDVFVRVGGSVEIISKIVID